MEVLEAVRTRRSIRSFDSRPVSDEDVIKILDAGRLAPSGGNRQAWSFIYVENPQVLRMVKNCSTGFYGDAPAAIVVGMQNGVRSIGLLDIGFAVENMLLAAHSLGLGGCAIGSFNREAVKKIVSAPENWEPILVVSLGYPDVTPPTPSKKSLSEVVSLDSFGKKWQRLEGKES